MKAWTHATLFTLLLACPVSVLGLDERGKASATPGKETAENRPQDSAAGPPSTDESSARPEAKDKVVEGESASGSNPPPSPPQAAQGQAQADERPGGEVCEEADILEEELPITEVVSQQSPVGNQKAETR